MATFLTGDSGSITYDGADAPVVADFGRWEATITRKVFPTTPFGYVMEKVTVGRLSIRGTILGWMAGTTPPILSAESVTTGTISLFLSGTPKKYVFKGRLIALNTGANSMTGEPETIGYQFVGNATTSSETIVAT